MAQDIVNITVTEETPDVVEITVEEVVSDKGADGYTPIKGVDYFDGVDGMDGKDGTLANATSSDLLNKLGYATDASGGAISPEDHILFKNKQPAGAYLTNTSVTRGTYVYHSQFTGDTVGDWRTYSNATGFYTQYCSTSNNTRGNGTWITKHTIVV